MSHFGTRSKNNLEQCDNELQRLFNEVIKYYDCSIICGYRGKEEQDEAYFSGNSDKKFPESKHNIYPSIAVDVVPYFKDRPHIRWHDKESFYHFAGYVKGIASLLNIKIRWGGDWNMNKNLHDQTFFDLPHFELVEDI